MGKGYLRMQTATANGAVLVGNVLLTITNEDNQFVYELRTDELGFAPEVMLDAPDPWHTEDPDAPGAPFSMYNLLVQAPGYTTVMYEGLMIFGSSTSILEINLEPVVIGMEQAVKHIFIGGHKLYDTEDQQQVNGELQQKMGVMPRILPEVTIPSFIRVHLTRIEVPSTPVTVPFIDYIKNVTSHEIFDHWPEEAIRANVYCIVSLTLNRIYTEHYRKMGFNFDITATTHRDQKYVHGGQIGARIGRIVDEIFNNYLAIIGHKEPFLALYNDGVRVNIPGRFSQWGSEADARIRGMNAWQIIRKYYTQNLELRVCNKFNGILESFPGYTLTQGSRGNAVRTMQLYLNRILGRYTNTIINPVDGIFGPATRNSVLLFQQLYNLPQTGTIDRRTWYEISRIFAVEKALWEMNSEGERIGIGRTPPTTIIRQGAQGASVVELQFLLDFISMYHSEIPFVAQTSRFDTLTEAGVRAFQTLFGINSDGVVGPATWRRLYEVYWGIKENAPALPPTAPPSPVSPSEIPAFPGTSLSVGSSGANVRLIQQAINRLADTQPGLWKISEDGIFGNGTRDAVMSFQRIFGLTADGVVGPLTWRRLMEESHTVSSSEIPVFPGTSLSVGATGANVRLVQQAINRLATTQPGLWKISEDGIFGNGTRDAVMAFQRIFGLTADGVVGPLTWRRLMEESRPTSPGIPAFPGTNLSVGSTGANVRLVQEAINTLVPFYPGRLWTLAVNGNFDNMVRDAIFSFQSVFGMPITGIVGRETWDRLMQEAASVSRR